MKTYGVIMAGGGGTRFWPLSRQARPKQLLNLSGKDLMVNEAIDRLSKTADKDDIFIVTNKTQVAKMLEATNGRIHKNHILSEPSARNTAACIGYAAMEIIKKYGDGIMVITPSDAYIKNEAEFTRILGIAVKAAEEKDALVTVGITPTFAATGYGYIKFQKSGENVLKVLEFKEKPDQATAQKYVDSGEYAWNSGMFIWKASTILKNFERFLPDIYADLQKIGNAMNTADELKVIEALYPKITSISIDYGIMEKADDVYVVPGEFGWNDVGSFDMMGVLHEADSNGNISIGDQINVDSKNCITYSSGRLVATIGLDNVVVIETPDAILVCDKNKVQDVKKVVEQLKAAGRTELL
ncbi:mannose-1-phosphate guanylyltransferase [Treponema ruminis]|uniref:mannose-1-phosphate guanylyltransferase n=1 Tax=Treponema ruminis TaxID=744515 RepID=A0A7W8LME0_9SPIR|nr:mannose-1-phosphate guanylyltransferase [Treponema ruminis]MBB5226310.1 mannose-1-phosphate guanylyltransferase [Treponema ruminis]QSI02785.1 mannose-1-phosphate guanylyltransferase [Treponema ruminis]